MKKRLDWFSTLKNHYLKIRKLFLVGVIDPTNEFVFFTSFSFSCLASTKKISNCTQSSSVLIYNGADIFRISEKGSQMIQRSKISRHFNHFLKPCSWNRPEAVVTKGQLISKAIYGLLTSPKKWTEEFVLFAILPFTAQIIPCLVALEL